MEGGLFTYIEVYIFDNWGVVAGYLGGEQTYHNRIVQKPPGADIS